MTATPGALGVAGLYCLVRGIVDFRQRRYAWAVASLAGAAQCAAAFLFTPIPTHAMKMEFPPARGS